MTRACGMRNVAGIRPPKQQRRERLRLEAAGRFARGDEISQIDGTRPAGHGRFGAAVAPGLARRRQCGAALQGRCQGSG